MTNDPVSVLIFIFGLILFIFLYLLIDYYYLSKALKDANKRILNNPEELKTKEKSDLYKLILNQTFMWGPFTLIEARKLNKYLKSSN